MADQPVAAAEPTVNRPESDNPNPEPNQSDPPPPQPLFPTPPPISNPNPNSRSATTPLIPPPSIQPYPAAPSDRPATPSLPQSFPIPSNNPHLPQPPSYSGGLPPSGVSPMPPTHLGQVPVQSSMPPSLPISTPPQHFYGVPGQFLRPPYMRTPNGYPGMAQTAPPPGILPIATLMEKPETTVFIGHISPTVENDFMISLLQLCGPVKSWIRPQDPTNGTLKGFGLYEFESPEGVLRALRLLSKLSIDGQELMLNVNQATRSYLQRYIAKKVESSKAVIEADAESTNKDEGDAKSDIKNEPVNSLVELPKPPTETANKDDTSNANKEDIANFGLINDEDRQADQEAVEKIHSMIEERVKNKPLPPPPTRETSDAETSDAETSDAELDVFY